MTKTHCFLFATKPHDH